MLLSLAVIFLLSTLLSYICKKLNIPTLLGMLITGIILGPYALNIIDGSILAVSSDLRQFALIIILIRAGLTLSIDDLKKIGRPGILMSFIPACFEIIGMILIAPILLDVSYLEAAIIGSVVAAVSPAVIVPRMIKLMEDNYGQKHKIPQLIMAGASIDDIFVIIIFTSLISVESGNTLSFSHFINIPVSIILGLLIGAVNGFLFTLFWKKYHTKNSVKVVLLLCISILFISAENILKATIPFSGLLAVLATAISIFYFSPTTAKKLSPSFSKLWIPAQVMLFVLVGSTVDINYALSASINVVLIIFTALFFRIFGVFISLLFTNLTNKEKLFCMIAYLPKATVQAAIGGIPLSLGLPSGNTVLTVAVLAILLTAPIGAFGIDKTYKKLLNKT